MVQKSGEKTRLVVGHPFIYIPGGQVGAGFLLSSLTNSGYLSGICFQLGEYMLPTTFFQEPLKSVEVLMP